MNNVNAGYYRDAPFPRADVARVKAGYIGHVYVANEIVWESAPEETAELAGNLAFEHITNRMKELFA